MDEKRLGIRGKWATSAHELMIAPKESTLSGIVLIADKPERISYG